MIGIVLNICCNIEDPLVYRYLLSTDIIALLVVILQDSRQDWPTNGASLALLQYAHQSLSNSELYFKLEDANVASIATKFLADCRSSETK